MSSFPASSDFFRAIYQHLLLIPVSPASHFVNNILSLIPSITNKSLQFKRNYEINFKFSVLRDLSATFLLFL